MAVYCNQCGMSLPYTARFCSNCSNPISAMPPAPARPLYRPLQGRTMAGVCIGLAMTYGWDVAIVRIVTVIGFFCSGGMVAVAYLACWIGIPDEVPGMTAYPGAAGFGPGAGAGAGSGAGAATGAPGSGTYGPGSYPPSV